MGQAPRGGLDEAVSEPPCPLVSGVLFWFSLASGLVERFRVAWPLAELWILTQPLARTERQTTD